MLGSAAGRVEGTKSSPWGGQDSPPTAYIYIYIHTYIHTYIHSYAVELLWCPRFGSLELLSCPSKNYSQSLSCPRFKTTANEHFRGPKKCIFIAGVKCRPNFQFFNSRKVFFAWFRHLILKPETGKSQVSKGKMFKSKNHSKDGGFRASVCLGLNPPSFRRKRKHQIGSNFCNNVCVWFSEPPIKYNKWVVATHFLKLFLDLSGFLSYTSFLEGFAC